MVEITTTEDEPMPDLSRSTILGGTAETITCREAQQSGCLLVDVRSAAEFDSGTIPGAVNAPLFDEEERSVIGTLYKHAGADTAVDQGFSYVKARLGELLGGFDAYKGRTFAIFCARGGMRSRSLVNLLNQTGHRAVQVEGGYKSFRHQVITALERFAPPLIVIHGLTGTGKTRLIHLLDNAIDLEELARHRSSLFGALDLTPRNQRNFEALLAGQIECAGEPPYFVEGESRKIGRVFIPKPFAMAMKAGRLVNITASEETRITRIVEDYPVETEEKAAEIEEILRSLTRSMGRAKVDEMCALLARRDLRPLAALLLRDYYDVRYARSMRNYRFDLELSSEDLQECAERLTAFRTALLQR